MGIESGILAATAAGYRAQADFRRAAPAVAPRHDGRRLEHPPVGSNAQFNVFAVRRRRSIAQPANTDEDQTSDEPANGRGEQHHSRHLEHPEHHIDADVPCWRRLLDDVDDDRLLLKQEQHG